MGLSSQPSGARAVHPDRVRRIHVSADPGTVVARLDEHSGRAGGGEPVEVGLAHTGGWTTVVLPGRIHPWAFHDLVGWLVDTPGADVVAVADVGEGRIGYWLVDDEEDQWLSGYDDRGESLSVHVPDNALVVDDDVTAPQATATQTLVDHGVPTDLHYTDGDERHTIRLEDPQLDRNPDFEATHRSRRELRDASS